MIVKLKEFDLWKPDSWPVYFHNWSTEHKIKLYQMSKVDVVFHKTTNGKMICNKLKTICQIAFDDEKDAVMFLLRYS